MKVVEEQRARPGKIELPEVWDSGVAAPELSIQTMLGRRLHTHAFVRVLLVCNIGFKLI